MPIDPLLFVYGTLKRGGTNHHLLRSQHWIADGRTEPRFALYDLSDYPGLVRTTDRPEAITGELWQVDEASLAWLDEFEECGLLFERELIPVYDDRGRWLRAWAYLYRLPVDSAVRIGPCWPVGSGVALAARQPARTTKDAAASEAGREVPRPNKIVQQDHTG